MDLYYMIDSPPCGSVRLTARALGLHLNLIKVDWRKKDHLSPEFLAINHHHCTPTLVDGDLVLWESRAICTYLCSKYGNDRFYSNVPEERCQIDKFLNFDGTHLYAKFMNHYESRFYDDAPLDEKKLNQIHEALQLFEDSFGTNKFCIGDHITVADHCLIATLASMEETGITIAKYSKILQWMSKCKNQMPGYEVENDTAKQFGILVKAKTTLE